MAEAVVAQVLICLALAGQPSPGSMTVPTKTCANRRAGMRHELKFPLGSMQGLRNTAFKKRGYLSEI